MQFGGRKGGNVAILSNSGTVLKKVLNEACDQLHIKRLFFSLFHLQGNAKVKNVHNFLKQTLTKFFDSSDLEWDELFLLTCYCYNIFPGSSGTESPLFLMFGRDAAEGHLTHLNNSDKYYGTNKGKIILEELCKLGKHHKAYLRELCQRKEYTDQQINKNNTKIANGQPVIVKYHACHTFNPKYLLDYKVSKVIKDNILLLVMPNGKERKTNINDVKPCSKIELEENVWDSFMGSIKNQKSKVQL